MSKSLKYKKIIFFCIIYFIFINTFAEFIKTIKHINFYNMDNELHTNLKKLYKIYDSCNNKYPMKCGTIYEGLHIGHLPTKFKSYLCKFPISFSIISQPTKKCFNSSLIISIVSSSDSFFNRLVYRKSYSVYKNQYPLYFFLGLSRNITINELIVEENRKYDDMIIFDYLSNYYNNSIQFIMSMRWLNDNCNGYRYVLSQQSDTFVNIPYYQKHFEKCYYNYSVISVIRINVGIIRDKNSPWYVPNYIYNETKRWPNFPYIPHIFLYTETVKRIVNASYYLQKILFMDDVYLGMLLKYSNLTKSLFTISPAIINFTYKIDNLTKLKRNILFIHGIKPGGIYYLSLKIYNHE